MPPDVQSYVAFINDTLALRAAAKEPALQGLAISFDMLYKQEIAEGLVPPSLQAAQGWIRYGLQHVAKSVIFRLELPWRYLDDDKKKMIEHDVITLDEPASSPKLETLRLRLGGAKLGLPSPYSAVVFASLTDLSL